MPVEWVERLFTLPAKLQTDPNDPDLRHTLRSIEEQGAGSAPTIREVGNPTVPTAARRTVGQKLTSGDRPSRPKALG